MGATQHLICHFRNPGPHIPCAQPQLIRCTRPSAPDQVLEPTSRDRSPSATWSDSAASDATGAGERSGVVSRRMNHKRQKRLDERRPSSKKRMAGSLANATSPGDGSIHLSSAPVPDQSQPSKISREPTHPLYLEAQMIFDGLAYFNERVSSDLISVKSHFNPYRVQLERLKNTPQIYVNLLVSVATLHQTLQEEGNGHIMQATSAVGRRRKDDIVHFRMRAVQELNSQLSKQETQRSNVTLTCILSLLLGSFQHAAYGDWRTHLEGARAIIKMRGGIRRLAAGFSQFRPTIAMFIVADVIAATTTPTQHPKMTEATTMALHYWEVAPNMFSANLAVSSPCPEDLFQSLILTNYLRTTVNRSDSTSRRHGGTRMVLDKIRSFNAPRWAARMKKFRGWSRDGESVEFEDESMTPTTLSPSSTDTSSPWDSPQESYATPATGTSPLLPSPSSIAPQEPDLWLRVGILYRCAVLLYTIRTLLLDIDEDKTFLLENSTTSTSWEATDASGLLAEIKSIHRDAHEVLFDTLVPIFSDLDTAHDVGKLVYFPAFMCAMEMSEVQVMDAAAETARKAFVVGGMELLGQACGTQAPICAAEEARQKWALDAREGKIVKWDEFFAGRPDFTVGY